MVSPKGPPNDRETWLIALVTILLLWGSSVTPNNFLLAVGEHAEGPVDFDLMNGTDLVGAGQMRDGRIYARGCNEEPLRSLEPADIVRKCSRTGMATCSGQAVDMIFIDRDGVPPSERVSMRILLTRAKVSACNEFLRVFTGIFDAGEGAKRGRHLIQQHFGYTR